jgi:nitrogen fixation-related uncharacterized protein
MLYALIVFAVVLVVLAGVFVWEIKNAPEGYQDESGFNYGEKPRNELRMERLRRELRDIFR